jgi:diacylglycerol kinase (ATP)
METVFVVVNPAADNGRAAHVWRRARPLLLRAGVDLEETYTEGAGHATALASEAGRQGFSTVLFVGGDGTMNEVANGLLALPATVRPDLAALPCGTGADLPRGLALERGAAAAVVRLRRRHPMAIDVAEASFQGLDRRPAQRFFVNIADAGLGGRVVERVNRRSKAVGGFASFLEAILATFWTYEKPELTVHVDGVPCHQGPAASVVVANGAYFAGGMRMAPQASFTDGFLDVVVLGDVTRRDLVLNLRRLYRGTHLNHPRVAAFRGRRVSIEGRAPLEMDGEHPGWSPLEVAVRPGALRILV